MPQYFHDLDVGELDPSFDLWGGGGLVSGIADLAGFWRELFAGGGVDHTMIARYTDDGSLIRASAPTTRGRNLVSSVSTLEMDRVCDGGGVAIQQAPRCRTRQLGRGRRCGAGVRRRRAESDVRHPRFGRVPDEPELACVGTRAPARRQDRRCRIWDREQRIAAILVRYDANGVLDTTFGSGGIATSMFGSKNARVNGIALQPDGRILVVGSSPTRWTTSCSRASWP